MRNQRYFPERYRANSSSPPNPPTEHNSTTSQGEYLGDLAQEDNTPRRSNPASSIGARPSPKPPSHTPETRGWLGMFQSSGTDLATLHAANQTLQSQVDRLRYELESTTRRFRAELMGKDAELAEMKKTLSMYNDCSEAELGDMVDAINKKIRGLARSVSMKWIKDASKVSDEGMDSKTVTDDEAKVVSNLIGTQLVNALGDAKSGRSKGGQNLLQYAWQACIVTVISKILVSFSARLAVSPEGCIVDKALQEISNEVMKEEVQPAYGRWRFITHRHLKNVVPNEEQAIQAYAYEALGVCLIAGRLILKNRCPDDKTFADAFQVQLKETMAEAFKLLTNIQEKMMTTNYEPYKPSEGSPFQPEAMDLNDQDEKYPNDSVICATGIGLLYWRKDGRENTNQLTPKYVFRKPQVLTEGNLHDIVAL